MARDPVRYRETSFRKATFLGAVALAGACSTIEPGGNPQIAQVVYDEDYFYCQVLPNVLMAQSCGTGDPSQDTGGGCHASATSFKLVPVSTPPPCSGNRRTGDLPAGAADNYTAAQAEMTQDPLTTPLLTHPTKKTSHPRQIFDENSSEADIIRQWAQRSSR
ncbi:MAG TPA: hypothetical protein VK550_25005 [Polyangiaceae bacterium]|nr:hypothetical protein [Polyangiaceae bacterium]